MNAPPINLFILSHQTGGEAALERAVLRLFAANSVVDLGRLKAASGQARREAAHLILGSARAIGAEQVARLAGEFEKDLGDLVALEAALADARQFIDQYLLQATTAEGAERRSTGSGPRNRL